MSLIRLDSTEADLEALHQVCNRLVGFDPRLSLEWLDGAMTALMAGPSVPESAQALLAPLLGDAWPRTFADPVDEAQALAPLAARWRVLRSQLDPEALYDDLEQLRLSPLLLAAPDEPVDGFAIGREWAWGFQAVVNDPAWGWAAVAPDEDFEALMAVLQGLADEGGDTEEREQRVDAAAFAAQDLRLWWLDHAPRTAPRKADALPGRNDPCHCGSGRKFKKCHGAAG